MAYGHIRDANSDGMEAQPGWKSGKFGEALLPVWELTAFATLSLCRGVQNLGERFVRYSATGTRQGTTLIRIAVSDSIALWVGKIRTGSPRALARAITAVEDRILQRIDFVHSGLRCDH